MPTPCRRTPTSGARAAASALWRDGRTGRQAENRIDGAQERFGSERLGDIAWSGRAVTADAAPPAARRCLPSPRSGQARSRTRSAAETQPQNRRPHAAPGSPKPRERTHPHGGCTNAQFQLRPHGSTLVLPRSRRDNEPGVERRSHGDRRDHEAHPGDLRGWRSHSDVRVVQAGRDRRGVAAGATRGAERDRCATGAFTLDLP